MSCKALLLAFSWECIFNAVILGGSALIRVAIFAFHCEATSSGLVYMVSEAPSTSLMGVRE